MVHVLNFAHGSLYMLGGYFGCTLAAGTRSFWPALFSEEERKKDEKEVESWPKLKYRLKPPRR
jgi:hypothetical protein